MTSRNTKRESNKSPKSDVQVTIQKIITTGGVIVAAITVLGGIATALFQNWDKIFYAPTPPLLGAAGEAATQQSAPPAKPAEIATFTPPPAVVNSPEPSLTPTPFEPTLCCLEGWDVFSTDGAPFTASPQGGCGNVRVAEIGVSSDDCGFVFGYYGKSRGVYGLSIPIQPNAEIKVSIVVNNLQEGEFWLAFSKDIDPQTNSLVYAMTPDPGGVSVFLGDISSPRARYPWAPMADSLGWVKGQPWRYNFTVQFDGVKAATEANDVRFAADVAPYANRMFIGYRSKPESKGFYLNARVESLSIASPNP